MKHGLSDNYYLKSHIEKVFGHKQFLKIKDYPTLKQWNYTLKLLLKSYKKAIKQSLNVTSSNFNDEFKDYLINVEKRLEMESKDEEELFSKIITLQSELIYLLIGGINHCNNGGRRTLSSNWNLNIFRETQIIQSKKQKEAYLQKIIYKRFTMDQIGLMAEEKRLLNNKDDFFQWILKEKMNGKLD